MTVESSRPLLANRYRVIRRLGSGGMATVYLAEDERLGRRVAVKRLHADSPEEMAHRFEREARLGASLNHPNLVSIYDTVTDPEGVLIVMEYVEGETLADALARGPVAVERAIEILRGLASALCHAHDHGVVHRDVKPANVLLRSDGAVKLADLGIATAAEGTQNLTRTGTVLGSPAYMAPEQFEGGRTGPPADVYALATLAFEMLGGRKARSGRTPLEIAHKVAVEPPPDLAQVWPECPSAVALVLKRGMARNPYLRPSSPGEFVRELVEGLEEGARTGATDATQALSRSAVIAAPAPTPVAPTPAASAAVAPAAAGSTAATPPAPVAPTAPAPAATAAPADRVSSPAPARASAAAPAGPARPIEATPTPPPRHEEPGAERVPAPRWVPPAGPPAPPPRRRRRLALPLVLGALLLLALAGGALALVNRGGGDGSRTNRVAETPAQTETPAPTETRDSGSQSDTQADAEAEPSTPAPTPSQDDSSTTQEPDASTQDEDTRTQRSTRSRRQSSAADLPNDPDAGRRLNDQGYALIIRRQFAEALPILQRSVASYPDDPSGLNSQQQLEYAYALFNLATALRETGRSDEAIPLLEKRLSFSNNQRGTVEAALTAARQEAGESGSSGSGSGSSGSDSGSGSSG